MTKVDASKRSLAVCGIGSDDGEDDEYDRENGVVGKKTARVEKGRLEDAEGGFGLELGRVADYQGNCLQDGRARDHDVGPAA